MIFCIVKGGKHLVGSEELFVPSWDSTISQQALNYFSVVLEET